jgi:ribosome-binding protein aMBF1 (putative translation factor)
MPRGRDDLEDLIAERSALNPGFRAMVDDALRRRQLVRQLVEGRRAAGVTRTIVAARMRTSESTVARLEAAGADAKLSTLARYAAALGKRIEWRVVDDEDSRPV